MTTPPIVSALGGLQRANARLNQSARNIVETTAREANAFRHLQDNAIQGAGTTQGRSAPPVNNTNGAPSNPPVGNDGGNTGSSIGLLGQGGRYIPSLAEEIVQLKLAANAYKTNAKLLQAADEILQVTIDSLGGRETNDD